MDIDIDLKEPVIKKPYKNAPTVILKSVPLQAMESSIFVEYNAWCNLCKHALKSKKNEVGGILVGREFHSRQFDYLDISAVVEADNAIESQASITFTHDTWITLINTIRNKYPDKRIVGWYHSHPGYGIFMSSNDHFIHKNFFQLSFQVALVIDPIKNCFGFYQWKQAKLARKKMFFLYSSIARCKEMVYSAYKSNKQQYGIMTNIKLNSLHFGNKKNKKVAVQICNDYFDCSSAIKK